MSPRKKAKATLDKGVFVRLDSELVAWLKAKADADGRPVSSMARKLLANAKAADEFGTTRAA